MDGVFAKRVSALVSEVTMASTSATPWARAASPPAGKLLPRYPAYAHPFDPAETARAGPIAPCPSLLGWPLPQFGTPTASSARAGDGRTAFQNSVEDAAVTWVLQRANAFAVAHFPGDSQRTGRIDYRLSSIDQLRFVSI